MTGYSKKDFKIQGVSFSLTIKSLNSTKGCDITIKTPRYLLDLEPEIRKTIQKVLVRGKISFIITEDANRLSLMLDKKKLSSYINTIREIEPEADSGAILNAAIKLPDIFAPDKLIVNTTIKKSILEIIYKEINSLNIIRRNEGRILKKEIKRYLNNIIKISKQLVTLELKRLKNRKLKIENQFRKSNIVYDLPKLESEMIYYFERSDITEERIRLQHHCNFFSTVMKTEEILGKKLNFISQEILREINTIGSKANDFEIQKRVVQMKQEIEKIKEQIQNVL